MGLLNKIILLLRLLSKGGNLFNLFESFKDKLRELCPLLRSGMATHPKKKPQNLLLKINLVY